MRAMFPPDMENELKEAFFDGACTGYFVEVGANDPEYLSQTWHLEQRGWTGVLVEPQPDLAAELKRRRRSIFSRSTSKATRSRRSRDSISHAGGLGSF